VGRKEIMLPLMNSESNESKPRGATKNSWNRNLSRAMITIMTTMIIIM